MTNSQQVKEWEFATKPDLQVDKVPVPVAVVETNPKIIKNAKVANATSTSSGTITILGATTNADRDVYLIGAYSTIAKDAACDMATGAMTLSFTLDGGNKYIAGIPIITLTAIKRKT